MRQDVSGNIVRMRVLAARLRAQAAQTDLELYRRKFESLASELEEAAIDLESRARFRGGRYANQAVPLDRSRISWNEKRSRIWALK
jgi:hypothetical protein